METCSQETMSQMSTSLKTGHQRHQKRHNHRLSHTASEALSGWLESHRHSPYPSKIEKAALQHSTGLTSRQLDTWFANARRSKRNKSISYTVDIKPLKTSPVVEAANVDQSLTLGCNRAQSIPSDLASEGYLVHPLDKKIFQCTFCTDSFASKFDWMRHETSLHLPIKRFICCPDSSGCTGSERQSVECTYCGEKEPTLEHIETHNHSACQERPPEARIFSRKDHLRQHLRAVHGCELLPHMDMWLLQADYVNSRCGFCGERFTSWNVRNEHIANHYRQRYHINLWRGCRGFDSTVSTQVVAAMPPFLIGAEKLCDKPFSASAMRRELTVRGAQSKGCVNSNKWEILVRELQILITHNHTQGFLVSDEALRQHARFVLYGQTVVIGSTAADSSEWLDTFKRAYCLGVLPGCTSTLQPPCVADDLEVYQDLGLPTPPNPKSERATALRTLFSHSGPVRKTDCRFSSIPVPFDIALPFETISKPWPDAGILGETLITTDRVFSGAISAQMNFPLMGESQRTDMQMSSEELPVKHQPQKLLSSASRNAASEIT